MLNSVKLKKWLVDNIKYPEMFNVDTGETEEEHFAVVLDAPHVLFAGIRKKTDEVVDKEKSDNEFNIMKTNNAFVCWRLRKNCRLRFT